MNRIGLNEACHENMVTRLLCFVISARINLKHCLMDELSQAQVLSFIFSQRSHLLIFTGCKIVRKRMRIIYLSLFIIVYMRHPTIEKINNSNSKLCGENLWPCIRLSLEINQWISSKVRKIYFLLKHMVEQFISMISLLMACIFKKDR